MYHNIQIQGYVKDNKRQIQGCLLSDLEVFFFDQPLTYYYWLK